MNLTVEAALEAEYASLQRVQDPPSGELGYGTDLSCTLELDPLLAEVDPQSPTAIGEAVIRRYITPRGGLADDADYGQDLRGHCNRGVTQRELRALSGALQGEAQKDDRVARATVSLTADLSTRELRVACQLEPASLELHTFALIFAVTDSSVLRVTIT